MTSSSQNSRNGLAGIFLSIAIIAAWATAHVFGVFFYDISIASFAFVLPYAMLQCWLTVGLFIVAHDAIHGSLVPGKPGVNAAFGWMTMTLYAGFDYRRFEAAHHAHHDHVGTADDPDFSVNHSRTFWPWYKEFMGRHFGLRPLIFVNLVVATYLLVLGASMVNIFFFYGLPAIASSAQLFYFGTYRPHRHTSAPFPDHHKTRTNEFGWWASLFSCYHFGYHHEHHLYPHEPWWRLPSRRLNSKAQTS